MSATFFDMLIIVGRRNKVFRLDILLNKVVVLDSGPVRCRRSVLVIPKHTHDLTIELVDLVLFHGECGIEMLT